MRLLLTFAQAVGLALPALLHAQDAAPQLPTTGDTVFWGGGCNTCNERFENGTRWQQVWIGGQDSVAVFASQYRDPDYVLLGIHVANLANKPVLFDPNRILLGVQKSGEMTWTSFRPWTRSEVAEHLAKRYKKDRQSQQLLGVLAALGGGYKTTQSQATAVSSDGRIVTAYGSSTTREVTDVSQYSTRIEQLRNDEAAAQANITAVVLAEQTLDPGRTILGLVAFDKQKKAKTFVFQIPVNRAVAVFAMSPIPKK